MNKMTIPSHANGSFEWLSSWLFLLPFVLTLTLEQCPTASSWNRSDVTLSGFCRLAIY